MAPEAAEIIISEETVKEMKMKKKLAIIALSVMTAFTGVVPANAFPAASAPKIEAAQPDRNVQTVQYWRHGDRRWHGDRR